MILVEAYNIVSKHPYVPNYTHPHYSPHIVAFKAYIPYLKALKVLLSPSMMDKFYSYP